MFSASELPPYFVIPQHIEMSFLPAPPRQLFFCCLEAPTSSGGETCLCDFAKVYQQMDPKIREKFEEKGVSQIINVYDLSKQLANKIYSKFQNFSKNFKNFANMLDVEN